MKKIIIALTVALVFSNSAIAATPDWVVQNKKVTPGALNKDVTQLNIATTVCKSGWTATIRPTVTYTNNLKDTQLKTTYASYVKIWGAEASAYEEDHLISLQLGGDPSSPKNLWPEPYAGIGARKKDVTETALKRLVCAGTLKLADAQKAILNWPVAYKKYVTTKDAPDTSDN
ncbi:hypothetical protein UFOVP204_20 [uncultured Caudovirales phage]|uniref:Uncharacterized protein n=1 Tax=uncultured Caudovirales phage TaxID=2100421 RepID=A0A6J7WMW0_9CAUD|nr:hypothetical protein UFOVP204_20 [uncultured Caudovirales phage]